VRPAEIRWRPRQRPPNSRLPSYSALRANISFSSCRSRHGDTVLGRRGLACVRCCWCSKFSLPEVRYPQPTQQVSFFEHVIEWVRSLPVVQAAGLVSTAPGQGWGGDHLLSVVEHPPLQQGKDST